jgi:hypothetical protein
MQSREQFSSTHTSQVQLRERGSSTTLQTTASVTEKDITPRIDTTNCASKALHGRKSDRKPNYMPSYSNVPPTTNKLME